MNKTCENCPARLLNENEVISNNIGNICSKVLYVFPRYDEEAIKDLKEIYSLATGKNFEEECYLTYAVRCNTSSKYNCWDDAVVKCSHLFFKDWVNTPYKHTILFGDAYKLFFRDKPDFTHHRINICGINHSIHLYGSLGIKHYNADKYKVLKDLLVKELSAYNI